MEQLANVIAATRSNAGWLDLVFQGLDDGHLKQRDRPDRPYGLIGWSPEQIAKAMKSQDGADRFAVKIFREWREAMQRTEMDNCDNLETLLRAVRLSQEENKADYEKMFLAFMADFWTVNGAAVAEYFANDNKLGWIRAHANHWPGPGNDWRDPRGDKENAG